MFLFTYVGTQVILYILFLTKVKRKCKSVQRRTQQIRPTKRRAGRNKPEGRPLKLWSAYNLANRLIRPSGETPREIEISPGKRSGENLAKPSPM